MYVHDQYHVYVYNYVIYVSYNGEIKNWIEIEKMKYTSTVSVMPRPLVRPPWTFIIFISTCSIVMSVQTSAQNLLVQVSLVDVLKIIGM